MSKRYPPLLRREIIQIVRARGFVHDRTRGGHSQYKGLVRNKPRLVTIDTQANTYAKDLLKSIIRQSGLTREEFYCSTKKTAKKIGKKFSILDSNKQECRSHEY